MKPSQRIYQQRDIAKNQMDKYASMLAERMVIQPVNDRHRATADALIKSHTEQYRKWRSIYRVLTTEGAISSAQEQKERKKKKKEHEEYEAAAKRDAEKVLEKLKQPLVVAEVVKEDTHNKMADPFSDYVQIQLDKYFASTTNTVTLNTGFPTTATTGTTWTFPIKRFKVAPVEEDVEGFV